MEDRDAGFIKLLALFPLHVGPAQEDDQLRGAGGDLLEAPGMGSPKITTWVSYSPRVLSITCL